MFESIVTFLMLGPTDNFFYNVVLFMRLIIVMLFVASLLLYVGLSVFLQRCMKLHKIRHSGLAFLPIYQYKLLGEFAFNKTTGWVVFALYWVLRAFAWITELDEIWWNKPQTQIVLQSFVAAPLGIAYALALFVMFVIALVKYLQLKRQKLAERRRKQPELTR